MILNCNYRYSSNQFYIPCMLHHLHVMCYNTLVFVAFAVLHLARL